MQLLVFLLFQYFILLPAQNLPSYNDSLVKAKIIQVQSPYIGVSAKGQGLTDCDVSNLGLENAKIIYAILINENTNGLICSVNMNESSLSSFRVYINNYTDKDFYGYIFPSTTLETPK